MSSSLRNIANIIGENADLMTCACSRHINKWSLFKPINVADRMTALTTQDYKDNDYGYALFTYNRPQDMIYDLQRAEGLEERLVNGQSVTNDDWLWKYSFREAPYRLTDFANYNNVASKLCVLDFVGDNVVSPTSQQSSTIKFTCTDFENIITQWHYLEGHRNYLDLIFLIYTYGTEFDQSGMQGVYIYKVADMVDFDGELRMTVHNGDLPAGNYELRFGFRAPLGQDMTTGDFFYDNVNNRLSGIYYALPPHTKQTFTVTSGGSGGGGGTSTDYFNYLGINFYNASYEYNDSSLTLSNVNFTNYIVVNGSTNKTFNLYIEYYYDNAAAPVKLGTASRSLSEEGTPWATINMNYNGTINLITGANLSERIAIRAELSLTVNNVGYTKTINTTIDRV